MIPDKKEENDKVFSVDGYEVVIEDGLSTQLGNEITIDYKDGIFNKGFIVGR